ncbi:MAG: clan AA aspartic protease [Gammaproteobacteria bacterium]|nr:clan AA aspartic protease [Gammaproteobacteria bacterium]
MAAPHEAIGILVAVAFFTLLAASPATFAADAVTVPMKDKGADTFYVDVHVEGVGVLDYLVDTGAGYMTINEDVLSLLQARDQAIYVRRLRGIMADGSTHVVPVYRIGSINIGGVCRIDDVEAAVFPGASRGLLGLSALRKAAPLMFSIEPPLLQMTNCAAPGPPGVDAITHAPISLMPLARDLVQAGE